MHYMCDNTNMKHFLILRPVLPFPKNKTFFMDRLTELHDLSICSTLKLQPHHTYTSKNPFLDKQSK